MILSFCGLIVHRFSGLVCCDTKNRSSLSDPLDAASAACKIHFTSPLASARLIFSYPVITSPALLARERDCKASILVSLCIISVKSLLARAFWRKARANSFFLIALSIVCSLAHSQTPLPGSLQRKSGVTTCSGESANRMSSVTGSFCLQSAH